MRTIWSVAVGVMVAFPLAAMCADDSVLGEPQGDMSARVRRLEQRHERISKDRDRIAQRRDELQRSYMAIQFDLQRLRANAVLGTIQSVEIRMRRDGAAQQAKQYASAGLRAADPKSRGYNARLTSESEYAAVQFEFQRQAINDQLRQMDAASRLGAERLLKVLDQLVDVSQAAESLQKDFERSQEEYWLVTDAQGRYCREEVRAIADALVQVAADNPAGQVARGVALRRLGDDAQARQHLDAAIAFGGPYMPVALAAKGELLVASGQSRAGFRELARASRLAKQDGRVAWLYAQALAADGRWTSAESAWKRLLQLGGYDAVAHRGLSLLYGAPPPERLGDPKNALKHARLACEVTGNTDWICLDALAIAYATAGDFGEAADQARRAAELAAGEKRELCLEHARKFESHQRLTWNWRD